MVLASSSSDAARAKADLDRYIFYYQRYVNHEQAGRFAAKHREATARRMAELQEAGGFTYSDVTFLNEATEALLEVRACGGSKHEQILRACVRACVRGRWE